jgi:hypothetical protein
VCCVLAVGELRAACALRFVAALMRRTTTANTCQATRSEHRCLVVLDRY